MRNFVNFLNFTENLIKKTRSNMINGINIVHMSVFIYKIVKWNAVDLSLKLYFLIV